MRSKSNRVPPLLDLLCEFVLLVYRARIADLRFCDAKLFELVEDLELCFCAIENVRGVLTFPYGLVHQYYVLGKAESRLDQ